MISINTKKVRSDEQLITGIEWNIRNVISMYGYTVIKFLHLTDCNISLVVLGTSVVTFLICP